ncbi:AMP-binding protein [Pseudonocardia acaciae]|uniref:AMP-binding protein n=1 Tax=Pseudonocardia acaciae TaxID=551276 RepID=UPI0006851EE4|nr:AMP-binding protein [Pseudonocardia acaciae]
MTEPMTLRSLLTDAARHAPDRTAAIGADRLTYADLDTLAHDYATGLAQLGVTPGDRVAVMLPNQIEFPALIFAILELGAVYTGIPVAYGERDVETILRRAAPTVLVTSAAATARRVLPRLATPPTLVVAYDAQPREIPLAELPVSGNRRYGTPSHSRIVCHIGFTSGTTGEPKGVMNSHATLHAVLSNFARHAEVARLADPFVNLVASPVGHHTGFLWGVLLTTYLRGTAVYLDRWNPHRAAEVITEHGVTALFGAPTFLHDLLATDLGADCPLALAVLAGAPIPRELPAVAGERFGAEVCPAWGMTEYGIGVSWSPALPADARRTDGVAVPGCEVGVVAADGRPAAPGEVGELRIRGEGLFLGYYQRPDADAEAFEDGWFRTGDTAAISPEGYLSLRGRSKDLIIRGGENIPVADVESLLYEHPDVAGVAVVGVPDDRLGERACAVVVPADRRPALDELCGYLLAHGVSKHFLPERLELVDALPMTSSGKVKKAELRSRLRGAAVAS